MIVGEKEGAVNRYEGILSAEHSVETKERYQKEAEFLAFYEHLGALGRNQKVRPNLVKGRTTISIPAYFALEGLDKNPINRAALDLLPSYSYSPGYGDTTQTHIDKSGLRQALSLPESQLEAARRGNAAQFIVAATLGLQDPVVKETLRGISNTYHGSRDDNTSRLWGIRNFVDDIPRDLNENVVGEVSDIAALVEQRGYADFLDYLVDVRQVVSERVATVFAHEAPIVD